MSILFILKEGITNLKRARTAALISILSIALALFLVELFFVAGFNLRGVFGRFYKQLEIEAFLEPGLNQREITRLRQKIEKDGRIREIRFISKEEALEEFEKTFGGDFKNIIRENPLPASFRIVLADKSLAPELAEVFVEWLEELPGVEEVVYQRETMRFLHKYANIVLLAVILFGLILVVVVTVLIFNTIRLSIHARRNIIEIMKLVGATNLFIKSPFWIEGILQGVLGGLLAMGMLWGGIELVRSVFFPQIVVPGYLFTQTLVVGILLGWMGSYFSVNRYLA